MPGTTVQLSPHVFFSLEQRLNNEAYRYLLRNGHTASTQEIASTEEVGVLTNKLTLDNHLDYFRLVLALR